MKYWTNLKYLAVEICEREAFLKHGELDVAQVKRVIKHLSDILAEEWRMDGYGITLYNKLKKIGMSQLRKRKNGWDEDNVE